MLNLRQHTLPFLMLSLVVSLPAPITQAKGLDELKPGVDEPKDVKTEKPSTPETQAAPAKVKSEKGKATEKAKEETKAKEEAKKKEPSKTSKALADKLLIGTSFGWMRVSHSEGDWHASGATDVRASYYILSLMKDKLKLFGSFRYLPADVVVKNKGQEFRGVLESYLFGGYANYLYRSVNFTGGAELAFSTSSLKALDSYVNELDLTQSGASFVIHGGAQWTLKEKVEIGPTVALGFGTFTSTQLAANVNFKF